MLCWNLPSGPKHRGWPHCFSWKDKQFCRWFCALKQRLVWFNLQRDRTRNGLSNIKETFAENLLLQMSVLHQSMSIFQVWSLKFIWWLGKNVKKKYLMCQIPIKLLKEHATPNSSLQNLKVVSATFLLVRFVCLKESTCETRKNAFYFTLKTLLVLEIIKF